MLGLLCLATLASTAVSTPPRFWPHYGGLRKVELLDGTWKFGLHTDVGFDSMDPHFSPQAASLTPNSTAVPSTMDVAPPGILGVRGVAMYRTKFNQQGRARIQFMGCSFYCRVFLDGNELGSHRAGGYVPWWLDLPAPSGGEAVTRELFVLADNRFNSTTAPLHTGGDFWQYGGLLRSVLLHRLPETGKVWVWRAHVFPHIGETGLVDLNITLTDSTFSGHLELELAFDGGEATAVHANAKDGMVRLEGVQVPNPRAWTLDDPQLHTLAVSLAGATVIERFGLRYWTAESSRIALNGKVVKLHGWNHHTQWPQTGASPTDEQMDEDIRLLKEGGAQFIRGAHYPQDQRWLDRLDEGGFAMWEETLGPNTTVKDLTNWNYFMKYQLLQLDEMLEASLNHPSIMTWAFFNEGPSDKKAVCPAYAACAERARSRDPTRFVTWANNRETRDQCLDHATLISFNSYPGWYQGPYDLDGVTKHWKVKARWVHEAYPGKPFMISETGCEGIYEWAHNATAKLWTVPYQMEVLSRDVDVALGDDLISGITLWHFFDFKINDHDTKKCGPCQYKEGVEPPTCSYIDVKCGFRPGGLNHKGVVDFYRRKKATYHMVSAKYNASKVHTSMSFV